MIAIISHMFDFHEKRKMKTFFYSNYSVGIIVILIILLSFSVFERFSVERQMKEKRNVQEEELKALEERAAMLEERVEHMAGERGIEEELRNRFDVVKTGEQVVIIVDETTGSDVEDSKVSSEEEDEEGSILDFFKFW